MIKSLMRNLNSKCKYIYLQSFFECCSHKLIILFYHRCRIENSAFVADVMRKGKIIIIIINNCCWGRFFEKFENEKKNDNRLHEFKMLYKWLRKKIKKNFFLLMYIPVKAAMVC